MIIPFELVENFKKCMDFDYFKATYAKNHSYVSAMFVHKFIFKRYFSGLVMAKKYLQLTILDEITSLIKLLPTEFYDDLKIDSWKIKNKNSVIYFRAINENNLRGWIPDLIYSEVGVFNSFYHKESDISNIYEAKKWMNKN